MATWVHGSDAMNKHIRREIKLWEPPKMITDNMSTYAAHYKAWPVGHAQKAVRPRDARPPTAAAFDTRTTMQDSYRNLGGFQPPKPYRPQSAYTPTPWMHPLSTTSRDHFQQWPTMPRQSFKPKESMRDVGSQPTGRSTFQDAYQPHMAVRTVSCRPDERPLDPLPFECETTSRAAFRQWPVQARYQRPQQERSSMSESHEPFGTSTYRDTYREMRMPRGSACALGIQVVNGAFYTMMSRGTQAPCSRKALMTTVLDNQTSVDIVVILSESEQHRKGQVLGEFTLDGISKAPKGVPQIEVALHLDTNDMLRVTATDVQGNRSRALSIKERVKL